MLRLVGLTALVALFAPTVFDLVHVWRTDTYAVHGLAVPFFALYFLWLDRERLRAGIGPGERAGIALAGIGVALLLLGRHAGEIAVETVSLVVALTGVLLAIYGARWVKAAAFPIAFLLFMTPPPHAAVNAVTDHLQLFAARFTGDVLTVLGVPSYRDGVFIELPALTLEVAEICNGLRFMMALLVLAVAFAHLTQRALWRKLALVGSAIPLAVLANAIRITAIAAAVHYVGPEAARGFLHHSIGKVVWALTLIPLFAIGVVLRWRESRGEIRDRLSPAGNGGLAGDETIT